MRIPPVPIRHVGLDLVQWTVYPAPGKLAMAAARAFIQRRVKPDLQFGVRHNDRANVSPGHDDSSTTADLPLDRQKHPSDSWMSRDRGYRAVNVGRANRPAHIVAIEPDIVEPPVLLGWLGDPDIESSRQVQQARCATYHVDSPLNRRQGQHTVNDPGIEVEGIKPAGDRLADRALARRCWAVDRDHQAVHFSWFLFHLFSHLA